MNVARILYPVEVFGQGKKVAIWFCGCHHKCPGCSNPELWEFQDKYQIKLDQVKYLVRQIEDEVDGFVITGGEPFLQSTDLKELILFLKEINDDILVYTGFLFEELKKQKSEYIEIILENIAILIDGKYIEELNDNSLMRGSSNQQIYILHDVYRNRYENYFKNNTNKIQNFYSSSGMISVGIHKPNFMDDFEKNMNSDERLKTVK